MKKGPSYCPVCQDLKIEVWATAKDYEYFSLDDLFTYYTCKNCDSIFLDPLPIEYLKKIYPSNYYSFAKPSKNIVARLKLWLDKRFFKKILNEIPGESINVLDIGGGTGWLLDLIRKMDPRIRLTQIVDIDSKAGELAKKNDHEYFEGTIEEFETNTKFDLILMLNLIEHVADPLAVLQKCETLLNPRGKIALKTPNTKSLDARIFRKSYWGGLHCPRHWIIFSPKSFKILISKTSLKIAKIEYTQGAAFWAFSIISLLSRKNLIETSATKPIIYHWLFSPLSACFAIFDFIRRPFSRTSQLFIILKK